MKKLPWCLSASQIYFFSLWPPRLLGDLWQRLSHSRKKLLEILHILLNQTCLLPVLESRWVLGIPCPPRRKSALPKPGWGTALTARGSLPCPGVAEQRWETRKNEGGHRGVGRAGKEPSLSAGSERILFSVSCSSCDNVQGFIEDFLQIFSSLLQEKR